MYLERRRYYLFLVVTGFFFNLESVSALEIEPGAGIGIEATDNVRLTRDNIISDQIATAFVGAKLSENQGFLKYNAKTSLNKYTYLQDSYNDQRYFYLAANANWEMVPNQFHWIISDSFSQRLEDTLGSNTPVNIQDTNVFKFGARINSAPHGRHFLSLEPLFTQYYYENSPTNNKQYSVAGRWGYKLYPTITAGLMLGSRRVDYIETSITDTDFTTAALIIEGQRATSEYMIKLGVVNVKREFTKKGNVNIQDQDDTGFSGSIEFTTELSAHSSFGALLSSNITDTSSVSGSTATIYGTKTGNQVSFDSINIELSSDVIRNNIINLSYNRADEELRSRIWTQYREIKYSNSDISSSTPPDRVERLLGASFNYPLTQLLSGGIYAYYNRIEQPDTTPYREDKKYILGGSLDYKLSAKLRTSMDVKYRSKASTLGSEDYDEISVFVNLVYGFGGFFRPTRVGAY